MTGQHTRKQYESYNQARKFFLDNHEKLIALEMYFMTVLQDFISSCGTELQRDYNEASYLFPFWQNYPPDERGRSPKGDQFPWIEVGEHVFGPKLSRFLAARFSISDPGLPTGPDERYLLRDEHILKITKTTKAAWLFVDIKSVGPRDDQDHTVLSHNQISGDGKWNKIKTGIENAPMLAVGARASHKFYAAIPPIYVLSDGTIAPVIHIIIKPVYAMLELNETKQTTGQPLSRITLACIPNGLLLTEKPNYLREYPGLLFPGKDDKDKNPQKMRALFIVLRINKKNLTP